MSMRDLLKSSDDRNAPNFDQFSDQEDGKTSSLQQIVQSDGSFFSSPLTSDSKCQTVTFYQNRRTLELATWETEQEKPCCSSKIGHESNLDIATSSITSTHLFKTDPEFYKISPPHCREEIHFQKKIKNEEIFICSESDELESEDKSKRACFLKKIPEKKNIFFKMSDLYTQEISCLVKDYFYNSDHSMISRGLYDYRRVQCSRLNKNTMGMEIDLQDQEIICFDRDLLPSFSSRYISKSHKRNIFQSMIKKGIDDYLRKKSLSHFIKLSLGEKENQNNSYISWKESISKELSSMYRNLQEGVLGEDLKKKLGKVRGGESFAEHYLCFSKIALIKQIMRHTLFSFSLEINEKLEIFLISRASMSYFLNRYSDCFLKEFIDHKEKGMLRKKVGSSYFSWRNLKDHSILEIITKAQSKFEHTFKSDQEMIRKKVLILEQDGFRPFLDHEFQGLVNFINRLVDFEGDSGIIERACRHFHKQTYRRYNDKERSKQQKKNVIRKKLNTNEEKMNCFKIAESYRQLLTSFLQDFEKKDNSLISKGIYDYGRVQYGFSKTGIEIEVTNRHLILFDEFLHKGSFFITNQFSKNFQKRTFQERLKREIDERLKKLFFLNFLRMSIPDVLGKRRENYLSWKNFISVELHNLSNTIAKDIWGEDIQQWKKGISEFVNRYLFFCMKSLIRDILRHALFSIPIEKKGKLEIFFVSRPSVSHFFNNYSDHFLNALLDHGKTSKKLITGLKTSYISWKKSRSKEIDLIMTSPKSSFIRIVESDRLDINKNVLVFEKDGFRLMTNYEFQAFMELIDQLIKSDSNSSFIHRSLCHFYKNMCKKK